MIFISSSCVKNDKIAESVRELADLGYSNIELSGGTVYYAGFADDLQSLKEEYNLNYLLHNYFPPPQNNFVLNLASLDEEVFTASVEHCQRAIALSKKLGGSKYAIHAGFFIDLKIKEIGKELSKDDLFDIEKATMQFNAAFRELTREAGEDLTLYLENNVLSGPNFTTYAPQNPFMLTNLEDYHAMKKELDFKILLDVGHLMVSCNVLNKPFTEELVALAAETDYIHISNNNSILDENKSLNEESDLTQALKTIDLSNKTITLEVYESDEKIRQSIQTIQSLIDES